MSSFSLLNYQNLGFSFILEDSVSETPLLSSVEAENAYEKGVQMLMGCKNPSLGDPAYVYINLYSSTTLFLCAYFLFRALRLIANAAKSGHSKAREAIATASALAWGGFPLSINKALEDFQQLASEGNPRGQLGLGLMNAAGIGVNASVPKALVYLTFAALGGDELAEMAMVSYIRIL